MSLCSKLIKLPRKLRTRNIEALQNPLVISCQSRAEFQTFFTDLMKTGNPEKGPEQQQHEKREEELIWQNELKGEYSAC